MGRGNAAFVCLPSDGAPLNCLPWPSATLLQVQLWLPPFAEGKGRVGEG